jgi:hypothetical protein
MSFNGVMATAFDARYSIIQHRANNECITARQQHGRDPNGSARRLAVALAGVQDRCHDTQARMRAVTTRLNAPKY